MAILDSDPAQRIEGQESTAPEPGAPAEQTISELNGKHFDIQGPHWIEEP